MRNWGSCWFVWLLLLFVLALGTPSRAEEATGGGLDAPEAASLDVTADIVKPLVLAVVFTGLGLLLFALSIWLIVKLSPFSIRREIEEDQNVALGIIVGAMILGMAIILSAAILG